MRDSRRPDQNFRFVTHYAPRPEPPRVRPVLRAALWAAVFLGLFAGWPMLATVRFWAGVFGG